MTSPDDPSYSERESALILQRAAELQAQQGRSLSLPELESAAAEAGIDVALVRQAADEVATLGPAAPVAAPSGGMLGAPLRLVHERVIRGHVDPSRWSDILAEIGWRLGQDSDSLARRIAAARQRLSAEASPADRSEPSGPMIWRDPDGRNIQVSLVPRGDRTVIRVEERLGELAGGLYLGMGLPLAFAGLGFILPICLAVIDMPVLIPVAFLAWAALAFGFARLLFTTVARQRDPQLHALADALAEICRQAPRSLPPG